MKTYKPKTSYHITNGLVFLAIIFFLLTLPVLVDNSQLEKREIIGLTGFWLIGIILTFLPFGFRLEVGEDYVKTSFWGLKVSKIDNSNIQVIEYGKLFRGGLGYGKGLNIRLKNGKSISIGEKFWGKEAFGHARRVLQKTS